MNDDFDVLIIGAGAGGGACAWALAQRGVRVLLLDAGPRFEPTRDYRLQRNDWELERFPVKSGSQARYSFGALQHLGPEFEQLRSWNRASGRTNPRDTRHGGTYHHVRGIGGSTLHYTGEAHRLNPAAMRLHSEFGLGADWPLAYTELEPYYQQAERLIGVAGPEHDRRCPRSGPFPLPAHPLSYASRTLGRGMRALGLSWEANSVAVLSQPRDGRPACNYCGGCNRGCPIGDKGSVDVTFVRRAEAGGHCRVLPRTQAIALEGGTTDQVSGVEIATADGDQHHLRLNGRPVVLAAGAVETPRLLLASGLGNESGQVGRHFMETLFWVSTGIHPEQLGSHRGHPSDAICWDFNAPDAIDGVVGGCRFSPATAEADLLGPVNYARRLIPGFGTDHARALRDQFGRALAIGAIGESLPHPASFIDLDPQQRDGFGMPIARIHSHLDSMAVSRLRFMADKCRAILDAAGIAELAEEYGSADRFDATHVFGTCRMGDDPATSVVDSQCRHHRWRNLWITDASVFPSSGGGESPSLTIQALALRTAARMAGAHA